MTIDSPGDAGAPTHESTALAALVEPVVVPPVKADHALAPKARRRRPAADALAPEVCDHRRGGKHFCAGCGAVLPPPPPIAEEAGDGTGPAADEAAASRARVAALGPTTTRFVANVSQLRGRRRVRFIPFERPRAPTAPAAVEAAAEASPALQPRPPDPPGPRPRPTPPQPVDALRAGLARPPKPRIALRWLLVGIVVALVAAVVLLRSPIENGIRTFLADIGIGRSTVYDRLLVRSVWANEIVPGRSGRYVADGLATTYWAFEWRGPPLLGNLREGSVVLEIEGEHELDSIGVSLGIQNGDAPFTSNPRPRELLITVGDCPTLPESCADRQQRITVADEPEFKRYAIDIPVRGTRVTIQVLSVYPSLASASVRPSPSSTTTTTVAGQRLPRQPGLTSWAALTEVVLFERS